VGDSPESSDQRPFEQVFYPAEQITLIEWQTLTGPQSAVAMMSLVTLLAFITGLSTLSQTTVSPTGPLANLIPGAKVLTRFAGVLFAFPLGAATLGLHRRKRLGWLLACILLPILVLLPLTAGQTTEIPLLFAIIFTSPVVVKNRRAFDEPLGLTPFQISAIAAIGGVGLYGTIGAYGLRGQFVGLQSWGDAIYYIVVTVATVGYGDVAPASTVARLFSLSVIVLGTGSFTVAVGALIAPAIESRMATAFGNMTASELALVEDHIVVLGYGPIAASFFEHTGENDSVVFVTTDTDAAAELSGAGGEVLTADPTDETAVRETGLSSARAVIVASRDDAQNVMSILAVRNIDTDIQIAAVSNTETHVEKMRAVGADTVLNLRGIGGQLLASAVNDDLDMSSLADQ
jgi:K+ transport systems, NAD-binding component